MDRMKAENKRLLTLAWHIEALRRVQRLPELRTLLGEPMREQTDEELWMAMQTWVANHNAKYEKRRQLGIAEVGD